MYFRELRSMYRAEWFLRKVVQLYDEYGKVANLRANAAKSEILAMEEEVEQVMDIPLARRIKSVGVRMGLLEKDPAWEEALHRIKLSCTRSGRMPLPFEKIIMLAPGSGTPGARTETKRHFLCWWGRGGEWGGWECPWCEARETAYHFSKTCSTTRM